jgi:hypothetical protein
MSITIWDDINYEAETIVVNNTFSYDTLSLTNQIYDMMDDPVKRHQILAKNEIRGLYQDLECIRAHRDVIERDGKMAELMGDLFRNSEIASITALDRVFINAYYRRLLRAKLEQDYMGQELPKGLVIANYLDSEVDAAIVMALRFLRIMCKFLGIESTTSASEFPMTKLRVFDFWSDMTDKFVSVFGETRISPFTNPDSEKDEELLLAEVEVLCFLNTVFSTWSGSTLIITGDVVKVIPATYVVRLLSKLK